KLPLLWLYWAFIFPLFMLYLIYGLYEPTLYVILACNYLRIMQQYQLMKLQRLGAQLRMHREVGFQALQGLQGQRSSHMIHCAWYYYVRQNHRMVSLTRTIREYTRFCGPLLSAITPFYISVQCYMSYVVLFVNTVPLGDKYFFMLVVLELNVFLFVIIDQCACVAKMNQRLERENGRICFEFSVHRAGLGKCLMIKTEVFQATKRFYKYSFRILTNYRICSK